MQIRGFEPIYSFAFELAEGHGEVFKRGLGWEK
jgi:hypothetical protein